MDYVAERVDAMQQRPLASYLRVRHAGMAVLFAPLRAKAIFDRRSAAFISRRDARIFIAVEYAAREQNSHE